MFRTTTHFKNWIFNDENELNRRREEAIHRFISDNIAKINVNPDEAHRYFLTFPEETALTNNYLNALRDLCRRFNPPMPKYVTSTAVQYFKRFYLNNSVMEHHPKHIMVTCVYLAAKIEEFYVSMDQFLNNLKGDREKAAEIVLNNELLLLHKINYQLIIWHPYRSIEGFLIDIKTRYPACRDPDKYRPHIDHFIDQCFKTDAFFLLCPNQLALLAIIYAAEKSKESIEEYLHLLFDGKIEEITFLQQWMIRVNEMIKKIEIPAKNYVKQIDNKLEYIQSKTARPDSNKMEDDDDDDVVGAGERNNETVSYEKYSQYRNEQQQREQQYLEQQYLEKPTGSRRKRNK